MNKFYILIWVLFIFSCTEDNGTDIILDNEAILSDFLNGKNYIKDNVIACAATSESDANHVKVYFYPEDGASDFKLYESFVNNNEGSDFSSYTFSGLLSEPFFNGTLSVFTTNSKADWFVVIYNVGDTIKIASPIRSKKITQPTLWTNQIEINQNQIGMPKFNWDINSEENNAIFFQVVANEAGDLLSGTYTNAPMFQYYKLNNVVLNITNGTPPELISGHLYTFTVMDVSIDNWVNEVKIKSFVAK